ncbi:hypothetical protein [Herbidospora cretacea]|uniref:hypothetical protein n=1 Tax=Herbidospora cretacea TaxID=28444 RepID=UPI000774D2D2|nr:hypothetical protein [Herbidospora cretacea]
MDADELHHGTLLDYRVNGPWGRILLADGTYVWFHEEIAFAGGEKVPAGEKVEFRARYQSKSEAWQAHRVRRHAGPVEPEESSSVLGKAK